MTQDRRELPFDVLGTYSIQYGWVKNKEKADLEQSLREVLDLIATKPDPRFGPVHTHIGSKELGIVDRDHDLALQRLQALMLELLQTQVTVDEIREGLRGPFPADFPGGDHEVIEQPEQVSQELAVAASRVTGSRRGFPAADFLLSNAYIPTDYDAFGEISQFMFHLRKFVDDSMELNHSPSMRLIEWVWSHSTRLLDRAMRISAAIRHRRKGQSISSVKDEEMSKEGERLSAMVAQIASKTADLVG